MKMISKKVAVWLFLITTSFGDEAEFKSLEELAKEAGIKEYGPTLVEFFAVVPAARDELNQANLFKTESAINRTLMFNSTSVAGRQIVKNFGKLDRKISRKLINLLLDRSNHGDLLLGGFFPEYAIEIIVGDNILVLNVDLHSKCMNISSNRVDHKAGVLDHWSQALKMSPALLELVEAEITKK
jgi:hypothetical protein